MNRLLLTTIVATLPFAAQGASIITNGTIQLGVDDYGQLNVYPESGGRPVGVFHTPTGLEATSNGCLCEGWGVGADGTGGSANNDFGTNGLSLLSFSSTASTATSVTTLDGTGLKITHSFAPASETSSLYRVRVRLENSGAGATDIADLRYTRTFDWDVDPTAFDEFVTIKGTGTTTSLLASNNNGFENSDPYASRTALGSNPSAVNTTDFEDFDAADPFLDQGSNFDFGFGLLEVGKYYEFDIYYGAARTEAGALDALGEVSAELYSLGQSRCDPLGAGTVDATLASCAGLAGTDTATFIFGFSGVGGDVIVPDPTPGAVPLPASALMLLSGLAALGLRRLRRA